MEELQNIEIAIELDRGKKISEVAGKFNVSNTFVKAIAKKFVSDEIRISKTRSRRKYSEAEQQVLVERVQNGDSLEEILVEVDVAESTLRKWCKIHGVKIPRKLESITNSECSEIREMLQINDWREIAKIYNVTRETIEELKKPAHSQLDLETLSYLFELIREKPKRSVKSLSRIMKEAGFDIKEIEVCSYKRRLKLLNQI